MAYQGNTEDYTDASFSLVKSCQCQVQLSEDKNPHTEIPRCYCAVSPLVFHGQTPAGQDKERFQALKATRLMSVTKIEPPKGVK